MKNDTEKKDNVDDVRVIKKYPNRRIYDTHESKYIKVDDIRTMVVENIAFKVIDSQSKEDVTRSVLLQIIIEQESDINPLFTSENLKNFIRYYGHEENAFFSEHINQSLSFFQKQQEQFSQQFKDALNTNPIDMFSNFNKEFSKQNSKMWGDMQTNFVDNMKKQWTSSSTKKK